MTNNIETANNNNNTNKRNYKMANVCWKGLTTGLNKFGLADVELHREGDKFSFVRNGQATEVATLKTRGDWKDNQWIAKACEVYGVEYTEKPKAERKPKEEKKAVEVKPVEQETEVDSAEVKVTSEGSELQEVKAVVNRQAVQTEKTYTNDDGDVITVIA